MEIDTYIQEALPVDVKGALEKMIVILLRVLNDQAKSGHEISEKHIDTMLYFLDIMERGASYSEGEDAMKILCEFMKNASPANKNIILKWLLKGDAEKSSKFRDYFFEHMARDINLMDILPGMGNSAEADLDILFSNPYFVKHSIFAEAHTGRDPMSSTRLNTLIAFLYNLKQKYGLSEEQTVALCEHVMGKLRILSVDSKLERIYELIYREIGLFGKMKISDAVNRRIAQDSDIPSDLNPEVKKLLYFYKLGGVLGLRELRQVFFSISARHRNIGQPDFEYRDIQVFYNVLMSLSSEMKGRYEEKEDSAKELRWNKYVLPFALFLSFDRQSLNEDESKYENTRPKTVGRSDGTTEEKPGRPTRFGRFV